MFVVVLIMDCLGIFGYFLYIFMFFILKKIYDVNKFLSMIVDIL